MMKNRIIYINYPGNWKIEVEHDFLARYVKASGTKQAIVLKEFSRRKFSRKHFLIVKIKELQVCKKMLLNTFVISEKVVNTMRIHQLLLLR